MSDMPVAAKKKLLIVDDSADLRKAFSFKFESVGYEVMTAENGKEALEKLQSITPDLILLDMDMPVMNGAETLDKIKGDEKLKNLPVVFLTNLSDPREGAQGNDARFAKEIGAMDYIKKTDDPDRIVQEVEKILSGIGVRNTSA